MSGIPILEVAMGLVFIYLLFSLLVSAVNEAVLGHLIHFRCHVLEDGLRSLLSDQGSRAAPLMQIGQTLWKIVSAFGRFFLPARRAPATAPQNLAERLLQHPLVAGLAAGGRKCPNYLPAGTFANAMMGILNEAAGVPLASEIDTLQAGIKTVNDPHGKKVLTSLLSGAKDLQDARQRLETWFNHSMDRVSGLYKLKIQAWLYFWAALIVLFLNLDTIEMARRLWTDAEFRTVLVNNAGHFVADTNNVAAVPAATTAAGADSRLSPDAILQQINQVKLPIGWGQCTNDASVPGWLVSHFFLQFPAADTTHSSSVLVSGILSSAAPCPQTRQDWYLKFLGLLLTVGAISQGAPFWFDVLNKVANLRAAGRPPTVIQPKQDAA